VKFPWPLRYTVPGVIVLLASLLTFFLERSSAFVLALAVASVLSWIFFHRVLNQRITRLVKATEKLAAGELSGSAQLHGSDELAKLSRAFDLMAQKISSSTTSLRQANEQMKQEINERSYIEEALRNSERRFRSIWENSLEAMRLTDSKGVVLAANPAYCRLMRVPSSEILEQPFTSPFHPEGQQTQLEQYQEAFRNRQIEPHQQKRVTLRSGIVLELEMSCSFMDMERDGPLLLAIFRNITDRVAVLQKLSEAKEFSENLIKTANVLIVGLDKEEKITIFNETAEQLSGFRKSELQGRNWRELFLGGDISENETTTGISRKNFDARLVTRRREERCISWQTNPILQHGEYAGTICFGIDITDKKNQEEQRIALERKLLDSQKLESLGVLAGGIAHDFNNLLAAILGNANLALMQLPPHSPVASYLQSIDRTSLRAADLCKQLLAYSGKGRFTMQYLSVNELVRETLELLEVSITKKAALRVELRPGVPSVYADPTQIRQVVMNLVINASEALGEQSGLIRVRTGVLQADASYFENAHSASGFNPGEYVFVEVSDNGCGMSAETQAKIFDPFFSTKFTGRGLGLAAVLGIVRGHNGALKILSEEGKGSTFKFLLPVATVMPPPTLASNTVSSPEWKGEGTILVVDDDPTVRAVTARMIEASGFDVLQAVDGRHGVQVFSANQKQIRGVVLDMTMPNLNGREAFEEMRRIRPDVKVLLISGFSEHSTATEFSGDGPSAFLQKPFRPEELNSKMRAIFLAKCTRETELLQK
jgi:two-component system, cell cycle sensor histidine kinase and response regulator CckA